MRLIIRLNYPITNTYLSSFLKYNSLFYLSIHVSHPLTHATHGYGQNVMDLICLFSSSNEYKPAVIKSKLS